MSMVVKLSNEYGSFEQSRASAVLLYYTNLLQYFTTPGYRVRQWTCRASNSLFSPTLLHYFTTPLYYTRLSSLLCAPMDVSRQLPLSTVLFAPISTCAPECMCVCVRERERERELFKEFKEFIIYAVNAS